MTLGHVAALGSLAVLVGALVGFVATGSLVVGLCALAAPVPTLLVYGLHADRADRSLWELWRGRGGADAETEAALDAAFRAPTPSAPPCDDGAFFVPGCPALPAPPGGAARTSRAP